MELPAFLDARAAELGIQVPPAIASKLIDYLQLLWKWNRKINLTALSDPAVAIDRLLLEPVAAARHLPSGGRLADLGSGGGSPALPLALALNASHLLMVESRSRKAAFLREAARVVGVLADVEAVRFEELRRDPRYRASANVVSMRAVRPDADALSLVKFIARDGAAVAIFTSANEASQLVTDIEAAEYARCSTWNITPSAMLVTFHVEHRT